MSIHVISWVLKHSNAKGNDRLALLVFAEKADDDGSDAWPSAERVAYEGRMARSTAIKCRQQLVAQGRLVLTGEDPYGHGIPCFTVRMDKEAEGDSPKAPDKNAHRRRNGQGGLNLDPHLEGPNTGPLEGPKHEGRGSETRADEGPKPGPEPSIEPSKEPPSNDARARGKTAIKFNGKPANPELWELSQRILVEFNLLAQTKYRPVTSGGAMSEAAKRVYGRVRVYRDLSLEDHADIIRRTISSRWWQKGRKTEIRPGEVTIGLVYGPNVFEDNITRPAAPMDVRDHSAEKRARDERRMASIRRLTGRD